MILTHYETFCSIEVASGHDLRTLKDLSIACYAYQINGSVLVDLEKQFVWSSIVGQSIRQIFDAGVIGPKFPEGWLIENLEIPLVGEIESYE